MNERARAWWTTAAARERTLVVVAVIVVLTATAYALILEPAARDVARIDEALAATRVRLAQARTSVDEIATLKRETRSAQTLDARAGAERVVSAAGLRSSVAALDAADGRVRLTFTAIDFNALHDLVDRLGREEQLFVVEALLAARVAPGSVRAELSLARPPAR
ncbi:MAG TPA: type II secretion system protein GspM [Casimicrobiaceae bacterium]|nr:type II secretion system protein GspM [Casimicrobiaceae bacterium]